MGGKITKVKDHTIALSSRSGASDDKIATTILLLGMQGSGKSTICNQMVSCSGGFNEAHRRRVCETIYKNIRTSVHVLCTMYIQHFDDDGTRPAMDPQFEESTTKFEDDIMHFEGIPTPGSAEWVPHLKHCKTLWDTPFLKQTHQTLIDDPEDSEDKMILKSASFFLLTANYERVTRPDYVPTDDDILHNREMTTGVKNVPFKLNGNNNMLRDVGGQLDFRGEWKSAFDGVQAVIYVIGLDKYCSPQGSGPNLVSNLSLLKTLVASEELKNMPFVVLLNKIDLFEEMIQTQALTCVPKVTWKPPAEGEDLVAHKDLYIGYISKWLQREATKSRSSSFQKIHQSSSGQQHTVNIYTTCALDKTVTRTVMNKFIASYAQKAVADMF